MDKASRPNQMRDLPMSDESMSGGTNGAMEGVTQAALERGFTKVSDDDTQMDEAVAPRAGQPGFLGRPGGWER